MYYLQLAILAHCTHFIATESPTLLQACGHISELQLSFLRHMCTDVMISQVCRLVIVQKHNHDAVVLVWHLHP